MGRRIKKNYQGLSRREARSLWHQLGVRVSRDTVIKLTAGYIIFKILTNPIVIGIMLIFTLYMIVNADMQTTTLAEQYVSLTMKNTNSKSGFDKKLKYIEVQEDGSVTVTVGYQSDVAKQETEQMLQEAVNSTYNPIYAGDVFPIERVEIEQFVESSINGTDFSSYGDEFSFIISALQSITVDGERVISDDYIIGFLANCASEGKFRMLEKSVMDRVNNSASSKGITFVKTGNNYFVDNLAQVKWLMDEWGYHQPGVDIVQWSGGRRNALLKKYKESCIKANLSYESVINSAWTSNDYETLSNFAITDEIAEDAARNYLAAELTGSYHDSIDKIIQRDFNGEGTAYNYACAICDAYEKPQYSCTMQNKYLRDKHDGNSSTNSHLNEDGSSRLTDANDALTTYPSECNNMERHCTHGTSCVKRGEKAQRLAEIFSGR